MPRYLIQASYNQSGISDLVHNPQDRAAVIRTVIERMGGTLESFYYAFGDYDVVAIGEFPDNATAAALAMAVGSGGALRDYKTTVLMSMDEAIEAMRKAGGAGYRPPGG
ncbi:MAG: GYD domain-containing protein [SAR202 cluster bacterium Io17-Chloro-G9]|nr:MAG: GYD domain-containing protein [SAR202 cluster bacterium Io17-Chloro-G9]